MAEATLDFAFITEDVKRQRELAQQALDEAKRITKLIEDNPEMDKKDELQESVRKWVEIARNLAENASRTSTVANATISTIQTYTYR